MTITVLLFILGLILLIKGGDWFVDGATGIAHRFHIPDLLIGATVVSIGTTLPEVMVSATSALSGHGEIAYGNAIGSIICNTAFIAAISIAVKPATVERKNLRTPVMFFFLAAALYCFTAYVQGHFGRSTGIMLLAIFLIYMILTVLQMGHNPGGKDTPLEAHIEEQTIAASEAESAAGNNDTEKNSTGKDVLLLVIGAALIAVGANLLVDNGILIARALHVPESVIGLTFVALGTSLPELVTAVTSLMKGHGALSIGNIIGANLFNLVLVSGVSASLAPFDVPQSSTIGDYNASLILEIPVMLFVMLFLTMPAMFRGKLYRFQGVILLCTYAAFCIVQFVM
ncbi:MAG: calcium/sodium antiporter [Firmicutes bacterium]|nr:calcium/sodium antiporter [Bacillota bacterium]